MALPANIQASLANQERDLLTRGQRLGRFDRIRQREFYSSYLFAPGTGGVIRAGRYEVFKTLRGERGQGFPTDLTERETNWVGKGRVPDNINLVLKSFHCSILRPPSDPSIYSTPLGPLPGQINLGVPVHPTDMANVAYGMILGVTYLTNTIPIGYLADFPGIGGAYGDNQASRQYPAPPPGMEPYSDDPEHANLPLSSLKTCPAFERRQRIGVLLQHGEQFSMVLIVPRDITLQTSSMFMVGEFPNYGDSSSTGAVEVRVGFWGTESFVERS